MHSMVPEETAVTLGFCDLEELGLKDVLELDQTESEKNPSTRCLTQARQIVLDHRPEPLAILSSSGRAELATIHATDYKPAFSLGGRFWWYPKFYSEAEIKARELGKVAHKMQGQISMFMWVHVPGGKDRLALLGKAFIRFIYLGSM